MSAALRAPGARHAGRDWPRPLAVCAWAAGLAALAVAIAALDPAPLAVATLGLLAAGLVLLRPLLAVPMLLVAVPFGALARADLEELWLGPTEALVGGLAVAWLARGLSQRRLAVPSRPLVAAILGVCALALFSITYAQNVGAAVKDALKWLELLVVLLVVVDLARDPRQVRWLLVALFLAGAAEAAWGAAQAATGSGPAVFELEGTLRAYGSFAQPNPFGGYLATILPLAAVMALTPGQPAGFRLLALAAGLVLAGGAALSQSRGAWLGAAVSGVVVLGLWGPRARRLLAPAGGALLAATALALAGFLPSSIVGRLGQAVEYFGVFDVRTVDLTPENWAVVERMAHWQAGWSMFLDHPWLGVGAGNYAEAYPRYYVADWLDPLGHAHNYYLNTLAELGLVGATLVLLLLALAFRHFGGVLRATESRPGGPIFWRALLAGVLGAMVVFCVHNLFDNLFVHSINVQLGFLLGLGLVAADELAPASSRAGHPRAA